MYGCSSVFNGEFPLACFHLQLPRLHRYLPKTPLWIRVDGILKSQHQTNRFSLRPDLAWPIL